jgi:hypothetical protein
MNAQLYNSFFCPSEAVGRFNMVANGTKQAADCRNCPTEVRWYKGLAGVTAGFAIRRQPVKKSQRFKEYLSIV